MSRVTKKKEVDWLTLLGSAPVFIVFCVLFC